MKKLFLLILAVQVVAYLILGWIHFCSEQNVQIPVSYILILLVAALNVLFLAVAVGSFFIRRPSSWSRTVVILLSIPAILWIIVLHSIKMLHRWG